MKYKIHVPTESFGFCEVEFEPAEGRHILDIYREVQEMFKAKEGLEEKAYNRFLDRQLCGQPNDINEYNQMSEVQKNIVQTNKRALKRIAAKQAKEVGGFNEFDDGRKDQGEIN